MVKIVEHQENDQVVFQQVGMAMMLEEEKRTQKLRILLIDDNVICLTVMSFQLRQWGFQVTPKREAIAALDLLRKNRNALDIVFIDVVRFDFDGFYLLKLIRQQFGIPVIMISANDDQSYIDRGMRCGATHCLVKPVQLEDLQAVCKLVIGNLQYNNYNLTNPLTMEPSGFVGGNENPNTILFDDDNDDEDYDDENKKKKKKKKDGQVSPSSGESSSAVPKKPRLVWDARLHQKFVEAVLRLNVEKAAPKKILEIMNEPNLTRENIASHLQKYRNLLRKEQERFSQISAKSPEESQQHFLNSTIQPRPLSPINFDNFCSGQEMIMSSNNNFNQQRYLHSAGNKFSQHHHLHQQQLIKNMANIESSSSSSNSTLSKTLEPRKPFFMESEYQTIDHRNLKNVLDQEFAMKQLVVYPQAAGLPHQETASTSSSSASTGNNIGVHHHHQAAGPPASVQPLQAASGNDVVPYQDRAATNVQSFQCSVAGGGDDDQARTLANVQPFQSAVGDAGDHSVPYQARPPTNVQSFQATGGGDRAPYEVRPPTNVQPFDGGEGRDVVVPYQTRPTSIQPSQAGGDGGYGAGNSADKGKKVLISSSTDDHVVHSYYHENSTNTMHLQSSSQFAGDYSIGGNNNDGYLLLQSIIGSNFVPNQASSCQPNTSLEESINNSIVPYQTMPTPQISQPKTSVEESINNSIVPNQAMPTEQQPSQPCTSIGGSIDDSFFGYQAMPSQESTSVEKCIDNYIVPHLAWPTEELSQPTDSIGEFFDNSFVPYQAIHTHRPSQPTDSIGGFIDNPIIPYQAWPTQELSQPTDYIGGGSSDFIVPYEAWHTQNSSHLSGSIGGNSGENIDHLLPSINSMVLYQDEHKKQPSQEINSFRGNCGQVGYKQPYITDHSSSSFTSQFLSPGEPRLLPPANNTNAEHVHDTSFVGENINGYDHQMKNLLPAADSAAKVSSNNNEDLPDDEISFLIKELSNYCTAPTIR